MLADGEQTRITGGGFETVELDPAIEKTLDEIFAFLASRQQIHSVVTQDIDERLLIASRERDHQ